MNDRKHTGSVECNLGNTIELSILVTRNTGGVAGAGIEMGDEDSVCVSGNLLRYWAFGHLNLASRLVFQY